jgi:hypothetical protein
MKAIYKYTLPVQEKYSIELPLGAKIVRVEDVDGLLFLWAIVDTAKDSLKEFRHLEFYKTGQPIADDANLVYLGLCRLFIMQELGLYCFERVEPKTPYTT